MKKVFSLTLLTIFLIISLLGISQDYNLSMIFRPSFVNVSKLNIKNNKATYRIYDKRDSLILKEYSFRIPSFQLNQLKLFLDSYKFTIKNSSDTTGWCVEIIDEDTVITSYSGFTITDGIQVYGLYEDENGTNNFQYYSPNKKSKDTKLTGIILEILFYNISDKEGLGYLNELYSYFRIDLGNKQINDSTYLLYGPILNLENALSELFYFMKDIKSNDSKKVFIDLTGFTDIQDTLFRDFMIKPLIKKKNTFLINPNDYFENVLIKYGFDNQRIIRR